MPLSQKKLKATRLALALATFGTIFARAAPISTPQSQDIAAPETLALTGEPAVDAPAGGVYLNDLESEQSLAYNQIIKSLTGAQILDVRRIFKF